MMTTMLCYAIANVVEEDTDQKRSRVPAPIARRRVTKSRGATKLAPLSGMLEPMFPPTPPMVLLVALALASSVETVGGGMTV